jgi:hypothetical protein
LKYQLLSLVTSIQICECRYRIAAMRPSIHSIARRFLHRPQQYTGPRLARCIRLQAPLQTSNAIIQRTVPSRPFSSTCSVENTFKTIPEDRQLGEEANPGYKAENFYPVRMGEIFKGAPAGLQLSRALSCRRERRAFKGVSLRYARHLELIP